MVRLEPLILEIIHEEAETRLLARTGSIAIQGSLSAEDCDRLAALFQAEGLRQRRDRHRVPSPTHYDLLGVTRTATADEIKDAFRAKAKAFHPDTSAHDGEAMATINAAYETLSDPVTRVQYDRTLT
jgi:DnaJ-domain-containing protein 1